MIIEKLMFSLNDLWVIWSVSRNGNSLIKHPAHYPSKELAQEAAQILTQDQKVVIYAIRQASEAHIVKGAGLD